MKTKLSIIVPIYNVEAEVARCVESILSQDYQNLELLLIDDGSTDNSGKIAEHYAKQYDNVSYYKKMNGGLSDARNYGLDKAKGEAILFVDGDDTLVSNSLVSVVSELESSELDVLVANAFKIEGTTKTLMRKEISNNSNTMGRDLLYNLLRAHNYNPAVWMNVYKTTFLKNNSLYFKKGLLHEDEEWFPRVLLAAQRVRSVNIPFYNYIIRPNSITTTKDKFKNIESKLAIAKELHGIYQKANLEGRYHKEFDNYLAEMIISTSSLVNNKWQEYYHLLDRREVIQLTHSIRTMIKGSLFTISPKMYKKLRESLVSLIQS